MLGVSDVVGIITAIQSIFFGFLLLILLVDEADNAFADVYSAAVSTQSIIRKIKQPYLIIGFTGLSTVLAMSISIANYETFILLIGAVFVPLFGVVSIRLLYYQTSQIHTIDDCMVEMLYVKSDFQL